MTDIALNVTSERAIDQDRDPDAASEPHRRNRRSSDALVAFLIWIPGALIFFRRAFTTGFDKIMGNAGDARLQVFGHEHWLQVLRGEVSWTSPQYFYPVKGVLGYTDTFFLNEIFYMPLRAFGMDEFLAFQWTFVLLSLVGFASMFMILRRTLELSLPVCGALATTFTFANNLFVKWGHLQMYSVYWLPLILLILIAAVRSEKWLGRIAWAATGGALLALLFFSTYYVAWFAMLAAVVFGLVFFVLRCNSAGTRTTWNLLRGYLASVIAFVSGFAIALVPFLITYLPVLGSTGGRTYDDAMVFAAAPSDVINLSGTNYLWGSLMRNLLSAGQLVNVEVALALTPFVVAMVVAAGAIAIKRRRSRPFSFVADACLSTAIVVLVLIVLPVRFGWGSLWRIPWTVAPGAVGIRAIARLIIVGGFFAVLTIGMGIRMLDLRAWVPRRRRQVGTLVLGVLLALAVFEQFNVDDSSRVDRSEELRALVIAPVPPDTCTSFFVTDSGPVPVPFYEADIDGMLISQHFGIPTLNGYSGQFPANYTMLDPSAPGYLDQVKQWATLHGISSGLCSYDRSTHAWSPLPAA